MATIGHAAAAAPARGLIVKLKDAPSHERAQALGGEHPDAPRWRSVLQAANVTPRAMRPVGRAAQLLDTGRMLSAGEAAALAEVLKRDPAVEWVVPNTRERRLQAVPDDPFYAGPLGNLNGQWWLFPYSRSDGALNVADRLSAVPGAQSAWAVDTGSTGVVVAVLDTGITSHPDLVGRTLPGYDFVSVVEYANDGSGRDADPSDPGDWVSQAESETPAFDGCAVEVSSWHGTAIAGQIAAATNNGIGVAALNWNASILPVRVAGKCGADVADIVDGMRWAAGLAVAGVPRNPNPARVVNISFGGDGACNEAYQSAIDDLLEVDTVVVAAAGNGGASPTRPASCARVVGVAALNRDGAKASYSNFGASIAVSTVGGEIELSVGDPVADSGLLTITNNGEQQPGQPGYAYFVGTSFAAPLASGVAALMLSVNPALSGQQLIDRLRSSARPHAVVPSLGVCSSQNNERCQCTTSTCGAGILDAPAALQFAQSTDGRAGTGGGGGSGGGGGGALEVGWLAGLAMALLLLSRQPDRRRRR